MTIKALLELKRQLNEIDDVYLSRFTMKNKDLSDEAFQEKFEKDQTDRLEAVKREEKREALLLEDLKSLPDAKRQEMIIQLQGVSSDGVASGTQAKSE